MFYIVYVLVFDFFQHYWHYDFLETGAPSFFLNSIKYFSHAILKFAEKI